MTSKDKQAPPRDDSAGGTYVGGNVHTGGGDFVGRDKIQAGNRSVIITGAASGNLIQTGDGNLAAVQQGATLEQFVRRLAELRAALPQAGLDADTTEALQTDVTLVETQAQKPKPNGALILAKLKGVVELLTTAVTASEAAQKLLLVAQQAVQWAGTLFH
jgi:hypothetical protein